MSRAQQVTEECADPPADLPSIVHIVVITLLLRERETEELAMKRMARIKRL